MAGLATSAVRSAASVLCKPDRAARALRSLRQVQGINTAEHFPVEAIGTVQDDFRWLQLPQQRATARASCPRDLFQSRRRSGRRLTSEWHFVIFQRPFLPVADADGRD